MKYNYLKRSLNRVSQWEGALHEALNQMEHNKENKAVVKNSATSECINKSVSTYPIHGWPNPIAL